MSCTSGACSIPLTNPQPGGVTSAPTPQIRAYADRGIVRPPVEAPASVDVRPYIGLAVGVAFVGALIWWASR